MNTDLVVYYDRHIAVILGVDTPPLVDSQGRTPKFLNNVLRWHLKVLKSDYGIGVMLIETGEGRKPDNATQIKFADLYYAAEEIIDTYAAFDFTIQRFLSPHPLIPLNGSTQRDFWVPPKVGNVGKNFSLILDRSRNNEASEQDWIELLPDDVYKWMLVTNNLVAAANKRCDEFWCTSEAYSQNTPIEKKPNCALNFIHSSGFTFRLTADLDLYPRALNPTGNYVKSWKLTPPLKEYPNGVKPDLDVWYKRLIGPVDMANFYATKFWNK